MNKAKRILNELFFLEEDYKFVAKEIYNQLYHGGINSIAAYFGASHYVMGEDKPKTKEEIEKLKGTPFEKNIFLKKGNLGFLEFRASGSKLKRNARVKIALNYMDTYDITVFMVKGMEIKIVAQEENVYFDELFDVLKSILG